VKIFLKIGQYLATILTKFASYVFRHPVYAVARIACPSVRRSVRQTGKSAKNGQGKIMKFSPYGSLTPLVDGNCNQACRLSPAVFETANRI